jgi:hypothetical protein
MADNATSSGTVHRGRQRHGAVGRYPAGAVALDPDVDVEPGPEPGPELGPGDELDPAEGRVVAALPLPELSPPSPGEAPVAGLDDASVLAASVDPFAALGLLVVRLSVR